MTICWSDKINARLIGILLIGAFLNISCKKENNDIGSDVIGNRSGFDVRVDTFDLVTYSAKADSVDTRFLTYYKLGQMNDPLLGVSTANIVTQFTIPFNQFSLNGATIDSVVLQLRYAGPEGIYGNAASKQTIRVYEVSEDLPVSLKEYFYSNRKYQLLSSELGTYQGTFNTKDSVYVTVGTVKTGYAPQLRIKLTNKAFINKLQNLSTSSLANSTSFKNAFKGLFISAESQSLSPGEGAMTYFNLRTDNPQTAVVLYTSKNGVYEKYELPISGTNEVKTNQYLFANAPALQPANGGVHSNTCYLQPAGIKTRILLPNLLDIAEKQNIAIQSARLTVTVKDTADSKYTVPTRLNLWDADSLGVRKTIADFSESAAYYGGSYDETTGTYTFNINKHVQNLLSTYYQTKTNINYGLNLFVPEDFPITASRAILDTDKTQGKVKLILTYTVIK